MNRVNAVLLAAHVDVSAAFFHDEQTERREGNESQKYFPHDAHP